MSLDALLSAVEDRTGELGDELTVELDRETRHELAMLSAALGAETDDLVRRAVRLLFQTTVDTAALDFHLRQEFDVTYEEFLSGMTYDEMTGGGYSLPDDDRRYQF